MTCGNVGQGPFAGKGARILAGVPMGDSSYRTCRTWRAHRSGLHGAAPLRGLLVPWGMRSGDANGSRRQLRHVAVVLAGAALLVGCAEEGRREPGSRQESAAEAQGTGKPSLTGVISEGFPLLEGLPSDDETTLPGRQWGRQGPQREWDPDRFPLAMSTCGNAGPPAGMPTPTDSLYAAWFDLKSAHDRQLMVFAGADQARSWVEMLSSVFSCKRETQGEVVTFYEPFMEDPGNADVIRGWVTRQEWKGRPAPAGVVHVVVKGRAVLLGKYFAGEGSRVDQAESTRMQDRVFKGMAAIIEAM